MKEEKRTIELEFPASFWKQFEREAARDAVSVDSVVHGLVCFGMLAGHRWGDYAGLGCIAWIPASEALPDADEEVLVSCENGNIDVGYMANDRWWFSELCPIESPVVHWSSITKPPSNA